MKESEDVDEMQSLFNAIILKFNLLNEYFIFKYRLVAIKFIFQLATIKLVSKYPIKFIVLENCGFRSVFLFLFCCASKDFWRHDNLNAAVKWHLKKVKTFSFFFVNSVTATMFILWEIGFFGSGTCQVQSVFNVLLLFQQLAK